MAKHLSYGLSYGLLLLMLASSVMSMTLRPQHKMVSQAEKIQLEQLIPTQFNDWQVADMTAQLVNPELKAAVDKVYAQTLSRTYKNAQGDIIMLSLAYGEDQSDSVGVHLPEGCYGGQGFNIGLVTKQPLATAYGAIPVTRVLATKQNRIEPITYWLRTGDKLAYPGWQTKALRINYGLSGEIPDGLLVRISSLTPSDEASDIQAAQQTQARFALDLLASLSPAKRAHLIGHPAATSTGD